ncbi:hypothetical protein UlMin_005353 [Ulmus minor]
MGRAKPWRGEPDDLGSPAGKISDFGNPRIGSDGGDRCITRKVVRSQCTTEEVEPGKFLRKCEKTEEILRDCVGRPVEVVQSNREYTEDDVTDQVLGGSFSIGSSDQGPFNFPGLRNDVEAIERSIDISGLRNDIDALERSIFSGIDSFFGAAEDLKNGFFGAFGSFGESSSPSTSKSQNVPIESHTQPEKENRSGHVDLSGLARDV